MKYGASSIFSKKFMRNAAIVLVIAVVAYVVMYSVREGFQAAGSSKEYPFDIIHTPKGSSTSGSYPLSDRTLIIPRGDYEGKIIKNIEVMPYGQATQEYSRANNEAAKKKLEGWIQPMVTNGEKQPIDRASFSTASSIMFQSEVITKDNKGKMISTLYTLRGPNYFKNPSIKTLSKTDIFLGDIDAIAKLTPVIKANLKAINNMNIDLFNKDSRGIKVVGLEHGMLNIDVAAMGDRLNGKKDNAKVILSFI